MVKSTYVTGGVRLDSSVDPIWSIIHGFKGLPRIKLFLWLACKSKVMTNVERVRHHYTSDDWCPLCFVGPEDVDHLLRRCASSIAIWSCVVKHGRLEEFVSMEFNTWALFSVSTRLDVHGGGMYDLVRRIPPPVDWFLVNTNEARHVESSRATFGSVIRDHLGMGSGFSTGDYRVQFRNILRNDSKVADAMAKFVDSFHLNCSYFSVPPMAMARLLHEDFVLQDMN
ncbi:hypothetical protein V6N11_068189 [Hibiscus sabdariffa]|uniref:Reverse transcriptase zinc-binding domain-containing protein n=1 Tax=Hibiscus sabdariffa TaxID=183260 RepID=A0ABR2STC8_9ROSI